MGSTISLRRGLQIVAVFGVLYLPKESLRGVEFLVTVFLLCSLCVFNDLIRWFRWHSYKFAEAKCLWQRSFEVRSIQIFTRQKLNTNIEDHGLERAIRYLLSSSYVGSYLC